VVNTSSFPLCVGALCGLSLLLCQCSSVQIKQGWNGYDPLETPSPQLLASLSKEASQIEAKLERRPDNSHNLARLADIRFLQDRESEAVDLYQRALDGSSGLLTVNHYARFGTALLHVERNSEACAVLEKVLREDPKNGRALLSYAEYQSNIVGNRAYAQDLLRRAKETRAVSIPADFEQALEQNLN